MSFFSVTDASSVWISCWDFGLWYFYTVFTALPEANSRESEGKVRRWCCANGEDIGRHCWQWWDVSGHPYSLVVSALKLRVRLLAYWPVRMISPSGLTIWRNLLIKKFHSKAFVNLWEQVAFVLKTLMKPVFYSINHWVGFCCCDIKPFTS